VGAGAARWCGSGNIAKNENLPKWKESRIVLGMTAETGLRERKKRATRAALSHAAWSLMVERGINAVTPEAIADAADVSPRTFRNYFSSREEAIVDGVTQRAMSIVEGLRARPHDEPVWDSLVHVLPDAITNIVGERDDVVVLLKACREEPALLAQQITVFEHMDRLLAEVVAERTGTDAQRDLSPRLMAAAAGAALQISVAVWAETDTTAALPDLVRESLAQLRAGLPLGAAH
jgi:AcrR family transcriptional regulator